MAKVKNKKPEVENVAISTLTEVIRNEVVASRAQQIFDDVMEVENIRNLSENIAEEIKADLYNATFLTEQLELTEKQKGRLLDVITGLVDRAKNKYLSEIKKEERTKKVAIAVESNLIDILNEMLSSLAKEVNRGALINCTAVAADTKNEDWNKIELRASKSAGDITIPTRSLLISTNCLEHIEQSISLQLQPVTEKPVHEIINN